MEYIKPTYRIKNVDIRELLFKFDFHRYNNSLIHRFPVYKYNGKALIYGEFVIYDDANNGDKNLLHINAIDKNGDSCSYNKEDYGTSSLIEIINSNIRNEIDKFTKEGLILAE